MVWVFIFLHLHLPSHWAKLWGLQVLCFALLLLSIKFKHEEEMFPHFYFFYFKFELHQNIICGTIKKSRIGLEEAIKNTNIKNNLIFEISFGSLKAICFASVGETIENYCVFRLPHIPHSIQEELKEYYWDQFQITFKQSIGLQSHINIKCDIVIKIVLIMFSSQVWLAICPPKWTQISIKLFKITENHLPTSWNEHSRSVAGGQNEKVKISIYFYLLYDTRMNAIIMLKMMKPFSKNLSSLNQLGLRLSWK